MYKLIQVNKITSSEKGIVVATCAIKSATGQNIPPAMLFRRVPFNKLMTTEAPSASPQYRK